MSDRQRTVTAGDELPVSQTVLETVADVVACDATELDPLYRSIDPESLDGLLEPRPGDGGGPIEVTFRYNGFRITVEREDDRTVTVAVAETAETD